MTKETIKIKRHSNVYCPDCNELILSAFILRHNTNNTFMEQTIYPNYCPICGQHLISIIDRFKEEENASKYR